VTETAFAGISVACAAPTILGESPVWDHRIGRLHWVDIRAHAVLTLDPGTGLTRRWPVSEPIGFVALTPDPQVVVGGLQSGLYRIDLQTGLTALVTTVEPDMPGNRINDGTVAADGAVLFGTMDANHQAISGTYWRYHRGQLSPLGGRMMVTNGPAVSPDGKTALTVDSLRRKIFSQTYQQGQFGPTSVFAEIPAGQGVPDGIAFDVEGGAWVAHYGGNRVTRFLSDGRLDQVVPLPAHQITKCAFGGADLRTLYMTSAAFRRSLADEPAAGCLFQMRTEVAGVPAVIAEL
jgi:sugar lactone lactonase YvrE